MASHVSFAAAAASAPRRRAPLPEPSKPIVRVYLRENGENKFVATVIREKIERHLFAFCAFLAWEERPNEQTREIVLPEGFADFAALGIVLRSVANFNGGHLIRLNLHLTTSDKCRIWDATRKLRAEPENAEERIRAHLAWRVTHDFATPDSMEAVYQVFQPFSDFAEHNVYRAMVHQHVWNLQHGYYTNQATIAALEQVIAKYPVLVCDIQDKYDELLPGYLEFLNNRARNAARTETSRRNRNRRR